MFVSGTVSIGTERLQGADIIPDRDDRDADDGAEILASVDLLETNEQDDQNDVVCSTSEKTQQQQDADADEKAYSSGTSFSRSFSTESDDPLFVNVIESGDEFKTIMDRNRRLCGEGSAIDEQVTYFPELFTHSQYKMYENCAAGKPFDDDDEEGAAGGVRNIYVPKKLNADELRDKLKEISRERKKTVAATCNDDAGKNKTNHSKPGCSRTGTAAARKANSQAAAPQLQRQRQHPRQTARKTKVLQQNAAGSSDERKTSSRGANRSKPRMTYYFEMDSKGKLKPLNNERDANDETRGGDPDGRRADDDKSAKFLHIRLKAAKNDENARPAARVARTSPSADLFLEFQTDRSGNKGAKLVIKKKPPDATPKNNKTAATACAERSRLPGYNGLRSEYGLSAEQLLERRRIKTERENRRKEFRQKKREEEQKKRAENEKNFYKWLQQKKQVNNKKQSKACCRYSYPMNRLTVSSARTST